MVQAEPAREWPPAPQAIDKWTWLLLAAMVLGTVLIYWRALGYDYTEWDDNGYVVENTLLKGFSWDQCKVEFGRNAMGNYHPITMLSYALDISIGGKSPRSFHLTNLLLHLVNGLLVFAFVRLLTGRSLASAFAALLFCLHPMRVENVAWISDRKDLLLVLFSAVALIMYLQYLRKKRGPWLIGSIFFFLVACLSKATAVALVPTLVLIDLYWERNLRSVWIWMEKIPFVMIAVSIGLLTIPAQLGGIQYGDELHLPVVERMVLAGANLVIYLAQLTVPVELSALYEYADGGTRVPDGYVLLWPVLALMGWLLYRWRAERALLFGALFFAINIALLLQFNSVGQAMRADRYAYLPSIGWALMVVELMRMSVVRIFGARAGHVVLLAYAGLLGVISYQRVPVWMNAMSLWDDMITHDPQAQIALASRSGTLYRMKEYKRSLADADAALRARRGEPMARYNKGLALIQLERYKEGVAELVPFIGTRHADAGLYDKLAFGLMHIGRFAEAEQCCDSVLRTQPENTEILNERAYCRTKLGRIDEAILDIDRSLAIRSDNAEVWYTRAFIDVTRGDTASGCAALKKSMRWPLKEEALNKVRSGLIARACP